MKKAHHILIPALAVAIALLVAGNAPASGASSSLEILYGSSFAAGDLVWLNGETGWFRPTNCPNKPVATLVDAFGRSFDLGSIPFDQSETNSPPYLVAGFYGPVALPLGAAAGSAHITVRQQLEFKLPVVGCFVLATKQATASLTIEGAVGDDPPELSNVHVPGAVVQRQSAQITWTLSKAATVDVSVGYRFNQTQVFWLDLGSLSAPAGAGSFSWNGTYAGHAVPIGDYTMRLGATDGANEQSARVDAGLEVEGP
jgi:hypothetical protein